jgi:hypothetical protein
MMRRVAAIATGRIDRIGDGDVPRMPAGRVADGGVASAGQVRRMKLSA